MTGDEAQVRIDALRAELQQADRALVEALARRTRIVETLAAVKQAANANIRDRARERAVLERVAAVARDERLDPNFVTRLFREIIDHSIRSQQARLLSGTTDRPEEIIMVGYAGTEGAYGHQAAQRHFSPWHAQTVYRAFPSFRDMLHAVRSRDVDYGVLPIENTTAGSINEAYDLLASLDLFVIGEEIQPIDHCLIGVMAVALDEIKRIYSHPQALAQCSEFLARLPWATPEPFANTALAVKKIADEGERTQAAIASEEAARLAGLPVIARDIANQKDNFTRFVIAAAEPLECDPRIPCKTSVMFVTRHEQGALVECLNVLAARNLNLTKLESRPRPGSPWEYQFYVDFEGNGSDPGVQQALGELRSRAFFLKIFGSYPARTTPEARVEQGPVR
jgi:chorismate mutase / prephenate dehydratase